MRPGPPDQPRRLGRDRARRGRLRSGITAGVRRHLTFVILGVLVAAGAIAATPALLTSPVPVPAGAVAQATATPAAQAQSSAPPTFRSAPLPAASASPSMDQNQVPDSLGRQAPFDAPNPALLTGYVWPLPRGRITNPFGPDWYSDNTVGGVRFHDGLDLATFCGDKIVAAHDGVVLAAGRKVDPWMGWIGSLAPSVARRDKYKLWGELPIVIVVDDGNGYRSIYAHFSKIAVKAGQTIRAGEFLGWEGRTGFATGCHLHYGLFSPYATDRFGLRADVVKRTKLPALEIARINPLLVLPPRPAPGASPAPGSSQAPSSSPNPPSDRRSTRS
jgi:murein DD-endopeptidase MepM/ murein hydrolase activator NlpD